MRGLVPTGVNSDVHDQHGQWLARPDLSFEDALLAAEYNGAEHADVLRMRREATRAIDLGDRGGWLTVVLGPAQVFGRLDQTVSYLARLRADRSAALTR